MDVKNIAVVGCGVIGASWAAYFLAKGFNVTAYDPSETAEAQLHALVGSFWPALVEQGLAPNADRKHLVFHKNLADAVRNADFVQESAPERLAIKHQLLAEMEAAVRPDVIISSSSSGLLVSDIQLGAKHPERIVLGHPFNPPHLIPLVEVIGGKLTSPDVVQKTIDFYQRIGKKAIHVRTEVKGHVANRLQAALWREAFYLVEQGVISVADLDVAISEGPGLRWALLGPFLNLHLSGGEGGIAHVLEHLGPPIEDWWADLGTPKLTPELIAKLVAGVDDELQSMDQSDLVGKRDRLLAGLLKAKAS
ncbi:3-hydroxyacyl-CoA dehydrogenase [Alcaligenaceae bacterium]|nr:3-hydroxyacyl-CoA dehydrogenase [Alcaligenaceae bacterium]